MASNKIPFGLSFPKQSLTPIMAYLAAGVFSKKPLIRSKFSWESLPPRNRGNSSTRGLFGTSTRSTGILSTKNLIATFPILTGPWTNSSFSRFCKNLLLVKLREGFAKVLAVRPSRDSQSPGLQQQFIVHSVVFPVPGFKQAERKGAEATKQLLLLHLKTFIPDLLWQAWPFSEIFRMDFYQIWGTKVKIITRTVAPKHSGKHATALSRLAAWPWWWEKAFPAALSHWDRIWRLINHTGMLRIVFYILYNFKIQNLLI